MRELVLIHGRSQENKDATALKQEWIGALVDGLGKSNLRLPIPETDIHFPYYGDTLKDLVDGQAADQVHDVIVKGGNSNDDERAFMLEVVREIGRQAGVTDAQITEIAGDDVIKRGPLNWGWVRAIISALDRHVPNASGTSIALFTKDVYQYIRNPGIRDRIEEGVRKAIASTPTVVVAHSLGSVVAYNLLRREAAINGWQVPVLVTVGCPLAVTAIRKSLAPNRHPEGVGRWFNAMDGRDIVALYALDDEHGWGIDPPIQNKVDVDNPTANRHGISGYLSDSVVAQQIHAALVA
jgi:hypothetical protein